MLPWENSKSGSFRGWYLNPILSHFCLFSAIFCPFLQFSTLKSWYIWFTISLQYPSAYVYSCCPGKILIQGLWGGFRGSINPILSHFCLISEIFCLFLQFSTLESCYIWFTMSLEYPNAYLFSFCPRKIQNSGPSGVYKPFFSQFSYFFWDFCLFFRFSHWNLVIFGWHLV